MASKEHYDLERRLNRAIEAMPVTDLRDALKRFVEIADVPVVEELAKRLDVPLRVKE